MLDGRDGGHATGQLEVEAAEAAGLFAYFADGSSWLQNTAPLTGAQVSKGVLVRSTSTRPGEPDSSSDGAATCTSDVGSTVLTLAACTAIGTAAASEGGTATISALAHGLSVSIGLHVWHPAPISLQLDASTLHRLEGCDPTASADGAYQATRLRVLSAGLDVTPLLGAPSGVAALLSVPPMVALEATAAPAGRVARLTVRGVAVGSGAISLVHRPFASVGVAVSGTAVTVASLYVGALTAEDSELVLSPSGALARGSALIASYGLRQQLDAEGDTARVLAVATLSDNTTMLVPHAQLNLSSRTPSLQPVAPDAAGSAPWSVEVATGAVRECGPLLSARWQTCGAVLAETTAELFLQLPEPTAVRISGVHVGGSAAQRGWASGSSLTLAPEGDLATLGGIEVPSSASFDVMVDFRDPLTNATSSRDFTLDPRASLAVSDAACAALVEGTMRTVAAPSDTRLGLG